MPPATGQGVGNPMQRSNLEASSSAAVIARPCGATGSGTPGLGGVGDSMSALSVGADGEDMPPPLVDLGDEGSQDAVTLSCLGVGRRRYDPEDFMLEQGLFAELDAELGPFSLEGAAAADGSNAHLDNFCYRGGRSFLTESLAGECVYVNPPFRLARSLKLLNKIY